jgi:hypothetical protein
MQKRYLLLFLSLFFVYGLSGQTQRLVLIEEATNASCGPCASQNPAFFALLNQNRDKITAVVYHWYFPGYDPMHQHNVGENNGRVSFYGINGVPTAVIDGVIPSGGGFGYPGAPSGFTQGLLDQYHAVPSPFEIDVYHYLSPAEDSIHVIMRITAAQDIEGAFRAHMAVVEKVIQFSSPPGGNGETTFHDVMKKMLPNHLGTSIPASWEEGDYIVLEQSWKLANVYDKDELGVVGFIQQSPSKNVQQAGNSEPEPFPAHFNTDAALVSVTNLTETNCSGVYSPVVTMSNYGSDPLTSVDIVYQLDDGTFQQTYQWTGNLEHLQSTVVELPEIAFTVLPENTLEIMLENPNGLEDEYAKNDTIIYEFEAAEATPQEVKLMIKLDDNPEEITWTVADMEGEIVVSGGPYADPGQTINETMNFEENGCYLFTLSDAGGDGLLPPGFFVLYHGSSSQIVSGTAFGSEVKAQFDVGGTVTVEEAENIEQLAIYPNPMQQSGVVEFTLLSAADVKIQIFNMMGQVVSTIVNKEYTAGLHHVFVDSSELEAGFYLISAQIGDQRKTEKITVIK